MDILYIGLLVFILAAFGGVALYIYRFVRRTAKNLNIKFKNKWLGIVSVVVGIGLFWWVLSLFSIGVIALLHFVGLSMVTDVVNFIVKKIKKDKYDGLKIWNRIYKSCVIPLTITVALIIYGYFNIMNVDETTYTVDIAKDIREEGYRIGLVADIHFGATLDKEGLQEVCDRISERDVDIMVLCGDITDEGTTLEQMKQVFEILGAIDSKYGIYYVYGNHDRQTYKDNKSFSTQELNEAITSNGIKILCDEVVTVNNEVTIVGRNDASFTKNSDRVSLETLLEGVDMENFILTLDHQPCNYDENEKAGTDLLLSGHTHGGQIWPANILLDIVKFDDAVYGITKNGDFTGLVTSGVAGWGFPVKTSSPAEYVIIDVK